MQISSAPLTDGSTSRGTWPVFFALVLVAFVWRMPYAATKPIVQVDEVKYSLPTVKRLLAGDAVFYISGTNYGAPTQEALAAVAFRVAGENAAAFRFSTVLFGSLATGLSFLALRRAIGPGVALGIGLALALANSSCARYTTFSHSSYATLLAVVAGIQLTTLWLDGQRTFLRWLALGALIGVGLYVQKLSVFQSLVSLAWLWMRSEYFERLRARLGDPRLRRRLRAGLVTAAFGLLLLAPVLYRFLTRRSMYVPMRIETALVIVAALCFAGAAVIAASTLCAPRRRELTAMVCSLVLVALVPMPAELWYRKVEAPRQAAQGLEAYAELDYCLKHLHEWPNQARLMIQGVFPALLIGRWNEVRGYEETERLGWKAAVAATVLAGLAAAGYGRWRLATPKLDPHGADALFIAPFLLTAIVLFPSWALHSESSFRYLLPFLSGFYLLSFRCLEGWITTHPRTVATLGALYVAYCAADCFQHIA